MNSMNFFINYCWKHNKKYVIFTFLEQLLRSIIALTIVILPKFIIDELVGEKRVPILAIYVAILVGYNFIGGWLINFFHNCSFIEKSKLFIQFQSDITQKVANADFEQIESADFLEKKEQASRFLYGNGQGFGVVFDNFASIVGNIFIFIGIMGIISTLNFFLLLLFILFSLITSYFDAKSKKHYIELDMKKIPVERKTTYLVSVIESFHYAKEIRLFNLTNWLTSKITYYLKESNNFYIKQTKESGKIEYINLVFNFFREIIMYSFLIYLFLREQISIGDFTMYITALGTFSVLLKQVLESLSTIRQYETYFDSLVSYINIPQLNNFKANKELPKGPYTITFENVYFRYPNQKEYCLKNLNLTIREGEKIAVVGSNGAGKTTFVKLLCRFYQPTKGIIRINGIDINTIDYTSFNTFISAVFQDYHLFSFSLKENICFSQTDYADELIDKILKRNGFDLNKRPNINLNTNIYRNFDDQGFEPSGGESQKIALSRAEFKDAPFIILDEPTSAMDPQSEYDLYQRFHEITSKKMAVFISHRLASTKFCDTILYFDQGMIVERGTHKELMEMRGKYQKIFSLQSDLYSD